MPMAVLFVSCCVCLCPSLSLWHGVCMPAMAEMVGRVQGVCVAVLTIALLQGIGIDYRQIAERHVG